ncbi:hypothetical protein [Mucilaginibacter sp.]|jgi:hypothetical protein|uniref:hypothetical protein n=1 Tax=Mucilaginibacter sp. TaxID=1882438 RepID=UPI003567D187
METLNINKANALTAYEQANDKGKALLSNLFGKEVFARAKFKSFEDIKTLADAIEYLGEDDAQVKELCNTSGSKDIVAYLQLRVIIKAINGGIVTDWTDVKVYKYYPWFNAVGSNSGFSFRDCGYDYSISNVGSRLCYTSSERATYAGKQFLEIYNQYIN